MAHDDIMFSCHECISQIDQWLIVFLPGFHRRRMFVSCLANAITLKELDQKIQLTISDNGLGLEDISLLERKSFGYSLIKSFAKKLDAEIDVRNKQGLEINILIKNYEKV